MRKMACFQAFCDYLSRIAYALLQKIPIISVASVHECIRFLRFNAARPELIRVRDQPRGDGNAGAAALSTRAWCMLRTSSLFLSEVSP